MEQLIINDYISLQGQQLSPSGKCNLLYNIIQIKCDVNRLRSKERDISIDIKEYLKALIELAESGPRSYDRIPEKKIIELVKLLDFKESVYYLNFLERNLQKSSFQDEIKMVQKIRTKLYLDNSIEKIWRPKSLFTLMIYLP